MEKKEKDDYYKIFTIPNIITTLRMIASVGLCTYIAANGITSPLFITLATLGVGATDAIDGFLARKCGMASWLGGVLDPIADKIYNWGIGITLMATGIMPLWPLLIAARDVTVFSISSYQFKKNKIEMKPTIPAKLKMLFQSMGVISTLAFGFGDSGLSLIAPICMASAIATVVPEAFCIKKKFFSNNHNEKSNKKENSINDIDEINIVNDAEKIKNKTMEYDNIPKLSNHYAESIFITNDNNLGNVEELNNQYVESENNISKVDTPKVMKKTIFKQK